MIFSVLFEVISVTCLAIIFGNKLKFCLFLLAGFKPWRWRDG